MTYQNEDHERATAKRQASEIKLLILNVIPEGTHYAAAIMALAECQKTISELWIDSQWEETGEEIA